MTARRAGRVDRNSRRRSRRSGGHPRPIPKAALQSRRPSCVKIPAGAFEPPAHAASASPPLPSPSPGLRLPPMELPTWWRLPLSILCTRCMTATSSDIWSESGCCCWVLLMLLLLAVLLLPGFRTDREPAGGGCWSAATLGAQPTPGCAVASPGAAATSGPAAAAAVPRRPHSPCCGGASAVLAPGPAGPTCDKLVRSSSISRLMSYTSSASAS